MQKSLARVRPYLFSAFTMLVVAPVTVQMVSIPDAHAKKKAKKKSTKKPAEADKSSEALRETGPAKLAIPLKEDKNFDKSKKADLKRDEVIAEIRELLPKVSGAQKGELVFRLAENFWNKSKYVYFKEFKAYETDFQAWTDNGRSGKEPKLKKYLKKSEAYKKQALKNYRYVLENYPDYPRLDEVLYIMAYNKYLAGEQKSAIKNYSQLIKRYPESEYVPDSYLALGEHYFAKNDLRRSEAAYKKAYSKGKEFNRPETYRYAFYKLAWVDYNKQEFDSALKKFKTVVRESEKIKNDKGAIELKQEALNDMVLTYSQLSQVEEAYTYLSKKAGKERGFNLTTKLAALYKAQGKQKLEIKTYRFLLKKNPDNVNAPTYQANIVQAYSTLGERDNVRKEVTRMVELYRPGGPWARKNSNDKDAVERARTLAENKMRQLVTEYHDYAQKFKNVSDYTLTRDIYKQYLEAFPDGEDAYNLNFYYAEILWDLDQWRDAAAQYDKVVERDPKGKWTRDSAWNAILAWEKIVKKEKPRKLKEGEKIRVKKRGSGGRRGNRRNEKITLVGGKDAAKLEPQKIPEDELKLAAACDRYVKYVTNKKNSTKLRDELVVVKFKSASIYNKYYHWDEAAQRFGELIDKWPNNKYARYGADSILDSYDARKEWINLEKWSRTFAKNKSLMSDKKFSALVAKFMEGASFKSIEAVQKEADSAWAKGQKKETEPVYASVADRYDGFVSEFPKSKFAPIALYNAQLIYKKARKVDLAIKSADDLLAKYSKEINEGDLAKANVESTTLLNLGAYHNQVADYQKAATTYEKFVEKYPKDKASADATYDAATLRLGLGDTKAAVQGYTKYMKEYPKKKDIPDVYLKMASVYEDNEDWKQAASVYGAFEKLHGNKAKKEQVLLARYKTAYSLQKADNDKVMRDVCSSIVKSHKKLSKDLKKTSTAQLAGGYCKFQTLAPKFDKYSAIKLVGPVKAVKGKIKAKKDGMNALVKDYVSVLNYGNGEWGVAGLYQGALVLLEFVDALRTAPDPPALRNNFEALDLYKAELDNIAFPVEEEAIKALEAALAKAFELGIYSEYTLKIEDKLREFKPGAFGNVHELPFFPGADGKSASAKTAKR